MAESLQVVDTSSFELKVYAAFHFEQLPDIQQKKEIRPSHAMLENSLSWVPLGCDKEEAVQRCQWGHIMLGCDCIPSEIKVLEITFTAHGAAYFLMNKTLTIVEEGRYRFHGNIPFRSVSRDGQELLQVGGIIDGVQVGGADGRHSGYVPY